MEPLFGSKWNADTTAESKIEPCDSTQTEHLGQAMISLTVIQRW